MLHYRDRRLTKSNHLCKVEHDRNNPTPGACRQILNKGHGTRLGALSSYQSNVACPLRSPSRAGLRRFEASHKDLDLSIWGPMPGNVIRTHIPKYSFPYWYRLRRSHPVSRDGMQCKASYLRPRSVSTRRQEAVTRAFAVHPWARLMRAR